MEEQHNATAEIQERVVEAAERPELRGLWGDSGWEDSAALDEDEEYAYDDEAGYDDGGDWGE